MFPSPKSHDQPVAPPVVVSVKETGSPTQVNVSAVNEGWGALPKSESIAFRDTAPPEVVAHIPILCDEKSIAYAYVKNKRDLGAAAGLDVGTATIAVTEAGEARGDVVDIINKLKELKK